MKKNSTVRGIIIGKNANIKLSHIRYLHLKKNIQICDNSRILCISKNKDQNFIPDIYIGNNVYISYNFTLLSAAKIVIEDHVLIASNVMICSENHGTNPLESKSYSDTPLVAKPIYIGEGCWLGERSIVLPGVTLGARCIVAAGSVVTRSFPPYSLIAGVPAKCIKRYDLKLQSWIKA